MSKPILILQMQRMGDLILSFPLLALLQNKYPQHPLWTVAEEAFFTPLQHLAPKTVFFPSTAVKQLKTQAYHMVINLSHRADAIRLAGEVDAEQRFGFYQQGAHTYIGGHWPLYRASMVHNNRFNLFHWSDLYLMEYFKGPIPPWTMQRPSQPKENLIGIFVGASEKEKRPSASFFAHLATALTQKGHRTFFLGGPDDVAIGKEAMQLSKLPGSSLCGRFNLTQLTNILQKMQLFITPDTGPMHLAAWVNTPILNISMGPVNPWETGPRVMGSMGKNTAPQHVIVQPAITCNACWKTCLTAQRCSNFLHPERIALLAHTLLDASTQLSSSTSSNTLTSPYSETPTASLSNTSKYALKNHDFMQKLSRIELPHLHVYGAGNNAQGLYELTPLKPITTEQQHRLLLSTFWQQWFWAHLNATSDNSLATQALKSLVQHSAHTGDLLRQGVLHLGQKLRLHLRNSLRAKGNKALPTHFWCQLPQAIQPLSGYIYLYLQNKEYSLQAWEQSLDTMEELYEIL